MALSSLIPDPNQDQPPTLASIPMTSSVPQLGSGLRPLVSATPSFNQSQESHLQQQIQDYQAKQQQKPQGFWQNVGHIASKIGNIAGDIVAPSVMMNIPGTDLHNEIAQSGRFHHLAALQDQDRQQSQVDSQNALRGAQTAGAQEETAEAPQKANDAHDLSQANAGNLTSETDERDNPHPQYEVHDTQAGPLFVNKATGQAQHLSVNGTPVGPKIATKTVQLQIGGKDHQVLINDTDGTVIKDLGVGGIKPPTTNINSGTWTLGEDPTTGAPKMFNSKTGEMKDAPQGMAKQGTFEKGNEKVQNIVQGAAMAHQLQSEAEKGNAEADPALALQFFKTIKGPDGTGIRFTQTEQNLILGSRNAAGDLEAIGQKVIGGGQKFSPEQRNNVVKIIDLYAQAAQRQHGEGNQGGASGQPQMIRAVDPNGVLHEAPAGTKLPQGWKAQ